MPKRVGYLIEQISEIDNIEKADDKARKNKKFKRILRKHDKQRDLDNWNLSNDLYKGTYKTSKYKTFKIYEPKERVIFKLPYYPDRICHHAIMNVLEPIWKSKLIRNTYSAIKGRGIHKCAYDVKKALKEHPDDTVYCLKLDVHKFYPSINHEILKKILDRWTKDKTLKTVNNEIIDSENGVPIGNYLSLYFANLYLTPFDIFMKQYCRYYFRYADDIVIFHYDKLYLHKILNIIKDEFTKLKLEIKPNYLIFPIDSRGVDFVGFRFFHTHILLRKSIKKNIMHVVNLYVRNKISKEEFLTKMVSYRGWLKFCDSKHLCLKIERLTGVSISNWNGIKKSLSWLLKQKGIKRCYYVDIRSKYVLIGYTLNNKSYETRITKPSLILYFKNLKKYDNTRKSGRNLYLHV